MIHEAFRLIMENRKSAEIVDLPYRWKRHKYTEPDFNELLK